MTIRPYTPADFSQWQRMCTALWPDQTEPDMHDWLARDNTAVLVAERAISQEPAPSADQSEDQPDKPLCGFAEVGTRFFADGCTTSPVAYLEGWYVDPDCRRAGVGAALIRAAEEWARARGLTELASDADLDNADSQRAHTALGFTEAGRAVLYVKRL